MKIIVQLSLLYALVLFFAHPTQAAGSKNIGHRIGGGSGEYHSDLPENSMSALKAALLGRNGKEAIQFHEDFLYLEFDIRETYDQELVLMHDDHLKRVLPKDANKEAIQELLEDPDIQRRIDDRSPSYSDLSVEVLTLEELRTLRFRKGSAESVPTLDEILGAAKRWGLRKPIAAEIKWIRTDPARRQYLDLLADFRDSHYSKAGLIIEDKYDLDAGGVSVFGFKGNLEDTFGDKKSEDWAYWCEQILERNFEGTFVPFTHSNWGCKSQDSNSTRPFATVAKVFRHLLAATF